MVGVVNNCRHCGKELWDEETSRLTCLHCGKEDWNPLLQKSSKPSPSTPAPITIKAHWSFILNTEKEDKAAKIVERIKAVLGPTYQFEKQYKYHKGGFRLECDSECESFLDLRFKMQAFSYEWRCTPYPFQGTSPNARRVTGVSWADFWIEE
jgi:hypothetical protein